jgi:hypothetical protein
MIITLKEVLHKSSDNGKGTLNEVAINSDHVVYVRPAQRPLLREDIETALDQRTEFSTIMLSNGNGGIKMTVVGSPAVIESKVYSSKKQLLKG